MIARPPPALSPPWAGPPAVARVQLGLAGSSARVRLRPMSALRLVASLSRFLTFLTGGRLSDPVVDSHEVGVLRELGDDLSRTHPLSLTCYHMIDMRHCSGVVCTRLSTWSSASARLRMGRDSRRRRRRSFCFLLRSRRASLLASVLSAGALADNLSAKMSSRYWSGTIPEGPGVSLVVMKTCRSGEPRLESLVATSVGVCSPAGASSVPSWKGSESR
jgi:hypothetical protein